MTALAACATGGGRAPEAPSALITEPPLAIRNPVEAPSVVPTAATAATASAVPVAAADWGSYESEDIARNAQTPSTRGGESSFRLDEFSVEAFWMPFFALESDEQTSNGQRVEIENGQGFGLRVGIGDDDQGIGLLYQSSTNNELTTSTTLTTHQLYADFHARGMVFRSGSTKGPGRASTAASARRASTSAARARPRPAARSTSAARSRSSSTTASRSTSASAASSGACRATRSASAPS